MRALTTALFAVILLAIGAPAGAHTPHDRIDTIAVSPAFKSDQTLFCNLFASDGNRFIMKSTDGGLTWSPSQTGHVHSNVRCIELSSSFATDKTAFAGTGEGHILRSIDGGNSWFDPTTKPFSAARVTALAISPSFNQDQTLFATIWCPNNPGFYKSSDAGRTWTKTLPYVHGTAIAVSPDYDSDRTILVADKESGLYKSTDSGTTWTLKSFGLTKRAIQTNIHYFDLDFSPDYGQDRTIFLGGWEGIHKSTDGGEKWKHSNIYEVNYIRGLCISPNFANDGTVAASAYGGGIYLTKDKGDSWNAADTGLSSMYLSTKIALTPSYSQDATIFSVSSADHRMDKSTTAGTAWFPIEVDPADTIVVRALAVSPDFQTDRTLFVGNGHDGKCSLYRSNDGGATFTALYPTPFRGVGCLALSPDFSTDKTIFAANKGGIFRSTNAGVTWMNISLGIGGGRALAVSPSFQTDRVVFAGVPDKGVYKSTDGGDTWILSNNGLSDTVIQDLAMSPDYTVDQTIFAVTKSGGLFVSANGGANWSYIGLEGVFLRCLAVSPDYASDGTLFLGTWGTILRSTDSGTTWVAVLNKHRFGSDNKFIAYGKGVGYSHGRWPPGSGSGAWNKIYNILACGNTMRHSDVKHAYCTLSFVGDSVSWIGTKSFKGGIAAVIIDDMFQGEVDVYSPQAEWREALFTKTGLGPGLHTIKIVVTGRSNPASTGGFVYIDAFEVTK